MFWSKNELQIRLIDYVSLCQVKIISLDISSSAQVRYNDAMKTPIRLQPLVDDGLVDEVIQNTKQVGAGINGSKK